MIKDATLNQSQFDHVSRTIYDFCGIKLTREKHTLVNSRLTKRLYALRLNSFDEYFKLVERDSQEFSKMIDSLTTNKTDFCREIQHFNFLQKQILPNTRGRKLRIWSAACSSGEEPYSIGMLLNEVLPNINNWDVKILATDISSDILQKAQKAEYDDEHLGGVSPTLQQKYFTRIATNKYIVRDSVKKMVRFARLNLMGEWKMQGPFDVIFAAM